MIYSTIYRFPGQYYNDVPTCPVYEWTSIAKTTDEILVALLKPLDPSRTCTSTPKLVSHNVSFLVDTTALANKLDWKCDDMGAWKNNGVKWTVCEIGKDMDVDESRRKNVYNMKKTYYKNRSSSDLSKFASFISGILRYYGSLYSMAKHEQN